MDCKDLQYTRLFFISVPLHLFTTSIVKYPVLMTACDFVPTCLLVVQEDLIVRYVYGEVDVLYTEVCLFIPAYLLVCSEKKTMLMYFSPIFCEPKCVGLEVAQRKWPYVTYKNCILTALFCIHSSLYNICMGK